MIGIGVNVNQETFASGLENRATSMFRELPPKWSVGQVRDRVLENLSAGISAWRSEGFAALWGRIAARDFLKGREVSVMRTDDDASPASGRCGGILRDGSLDVGGEAVYAGEAHVAESL